MRPRAVGRARLRLTSRPADSLTVQLPSVDKLGGEVESLQQDVCSLPDDPKAILDYLVRLRTLAVYLNAHLTGPQIDEA